MAWFDELFLPPGVTVPIPPQSQFRPPFRYGLQDQRTGDLHSSVYGTPFIPTPFDSGVNEIRPSVGAPGQLDLTGKTVPTPAMFGRQPSPAAMPMPGTLPEGANPPGAMGLGDLAYPGAMTPPSSPNVSRETPRKPFDWGPDASLWPMLMQAGSAMMQPSYYGLGGQLQQGLTAAGEAAQKAPTQRLQRQLMEAQVGKAEAETEQRQQWKTFLQSLPKDHPLKAWGSFVTPDKVVDKIFSKPGEGMTYDLASGGWKVDPQWLQAQILKSAAGATTVGLKTEAQATAIEKLWRDYQARAKAATDPTEKQRLQNTADAYYRQMTIGDKQYPEWYTKAARQLSEATNAAGNLATLLMDPKVSRLNFNDRASIAQQFESLRLAYADLKNRGANFTKEEQAMIEALAGGNPQSLQNMALRDRQDFVSKLKTAHAAMIREWNSIESAFNTGKPLIAPFPQFQQPNQPGKKTSRSGLQYETGP